MPETCHLSLCFFPLLWCFHSRTGIVVHSYPYPFYKHNHYIHKLYISHTCFTCCHHSTAKNTNVLYNNSATATAASTCLHTGSHCHPHFFMSLWQCFPVCLESCEKYFIEHMDAKMVLETPQSKVIPEQIDRKIMEVDTGQEANDILFDYLMHVQQFQVLLYLIMYSCL